MPEQPPHDDMDDDDNVSSEYELRLELELFLTNLVKNVIPWGYVELNVCMKCVRPF